MPQSLTSMLDTVSTARGSGWVGDETCDIGVDFCIWMIDPPATAGGTDLNQANP